MFPIAIKSPDATTKGSIKDIPVKACFFNCSFFHITFFIAFLPTGYNHTFLPWADKRYIFSLFPEFFLDFIDKCFW